MPILSAVILGAISVLIIILARDFGHLSVGKAFVAILSAAAVFLVEDIVPAPLREIARSISTMVPALFWLLCQLAFAYRAKIASISGAIAAYTFMAPAFVRIFGITSEHHPDLYFYTWNLATYLEYLIIGLGLWAVIAHWEDDLVQSSRNLRSVVLISVGITVLLVVIPMNTRLFDMSISYLAILSTILLCSYFLIEGKKGALYGVQNSFLDVKYKPASVKLEKESIDLEVLAKPIAPLEENSDQLKLAKLMSEGFYRTEHLTIKILANALALPEYKTRALINQTLGYRNFNGYINQLRIQEAAQRLINEPETPILNISLDVGYRTISSFNRAFKDIQDITPTEYRQTNSLKQPG